MNIKNNYLDYLNDLEYANSFSSVLNNYSEDETFQQKSVKELLCKTLMVLNQEKNIYSEENKLLLKAPTGAGKTIISGGYIDSLNENLKNVVYLWISPSPKLINQSKIKIQEYFSIECQNYEDIKNLTGHSLPNKSITFINWEKITGLNARENNERNKSIDVLINEAIREGKKIITIIDEAHMYVKTEKSQGFLGDIKSDVILNITATPTADLLNLEEKYKIIVSIDDVKDAGYIKKGIIINKELANDIVYNKSYQDKEDINSLRDYILRESILQKERLKHQLYYYKQEYNKENLVNPLLLIQVPNNNEELVDYIKIYLDREGYSESKGNLMVYMHNEKSNKSIEDINNDNEIEILLFKQAIATGWDCPRASVLAFMREPKTHGFTMQTVGRILRMPYLEPYPEKFDILNYGYIYIEESNNEILQTIEKEVSVKHGLKINIQDKFVDKNLEIMNLNKLINEKSDENEKEEKELNKKVYREFNNQKWINLLDFDKKYSITLIAGKTNIMNYYENTIEIENVNDLKNKEISLDDLSDDDIKNKFKQVCLNEKIDDKFIICILNQLLKENYDEIEIYKVIIKNISSIKNKIKEITNHFKTTKIISTKIIEHKIPKSIYLNNVKDNDDNLYLIENYLYGTYYMNEKNQLENKMVNYLNNNQNIIVWYKNGNKGINNFSLVYDNDNNNLFYPDFIIETKDTIYILETKGDVFLDKEETINKVSALYSYQKLQEINNPKIEKKIKARIVKEVNGELYWFVGSNADLYRKHYNSLNSDYWEKINI